MQTKNIKTKWKNQYTKIDSASKFHEKIRIILVDDPWFKSFRCYQEVPVSGLVEGYPYNNHHIDWYIDELSTVIELHGAQHYKMTNFGNTGYEEASKSFNQMKYRDNLKKQTLLDAGYNYLEIPYKMKEKLNGKKLKELIINLI